MPAFDWLKRDAAGLITVVVQDRHTGLVRMVAHANDEALRNTLETGFAHFFSRSRQKQWKKGEESGHVLHVHEVWTDCDGDCLVYLVDPEGPSCHTGAETCFYRRVDRDGALHDGGLAAPTFPRLERELIARRDASAEQSYTRSLLDKGAPKIAEKIREEGGELAQAVESETDERVVSESGDVVYHLLVGLLFRKLSLRG
ncbi:MAG TPA: bifunctional phosphoribosyl-AMP cyclohydrolase/phosphoribosyl-ATP diphosphatase HisIE, partial [Polyangiales bacterium]|nr:bifunctional phosphoribosyl-AMP cyclohydrolase/phosphoribosyl-ATP diphosphatase HisIE [Polyangiales bacterium]